MTTSTAEFDLAIRPGTVIAEKYRIEGTLGRGGMGVVLKARHMELDQDVAIKLMLPAAAANPDAATRFLREGKAAARLTSPHVAKVYDVGKLPTGQPYLVMEFLRGRDLDAIITTTGAQPLADVIEWVLEAAEGLEEAHALGIVHRDIKPANLFLAATPTGRKVVKVLDFGISKQLDTGNVEITKTSSTVGSPLYMAPEQMSSSKRVDQRADIWALGTVLYSLATARTPFLGTSLTDVVSEVLLNDPQPPSIHVRSLPSSFDAVVMRCLAKRPDERFQSVGALSAALRAVLDGSVLGGPRGSAAITGPVELEQPSPASELPATLRASWNEPTQYGDAVPPAMNSQSAAQPSAGSKPLPAVGSRSGSAIHSWQTTSGTLPRSPKRGLLIGGSLVGLFAIVGGGYAIFSAMQSNPRGARSIETAATAPLVATSPAQPPTIEPRIASTPIPDAVIVEPAASDRAAPRASASASNGGDHLTTTPPIVPRPLPVAPSLPTATPVVSTPPPPIQNCNPPYTIDAAGHREYKRECL